MARTVLGTVVLGGTPPLGTSTPPPPPSGERFRVTGTVTTPGGTVPTPPDFVYGTTVPNRLGADPNVGLPAGTSLTTVTSFDPTTASNTTFTAKKFACYVSLTNVSNAEFVDCTFPGPASGGAANGIIVNSTRAGGTVTGTSTDVVGRWGSKGQNRFTRCTFGNAFTDPAGSNLIFSSGLFGHHYIADRCLFLNCVDNTSVNNTTGGAQNLYVEHWGCYYGQLDGRYPDPYGGHPDGTHNDGCELTSGSFAYWIGCLFDARMDNHSTTHPMYFIKDENGAGKAPVTISQPNSCIALLQNTDSGQTGKISDVEIDQNWFHVTGAGPLDFNEKGHGAMKRIKVTNNRCYYDGVTYSNATILSWGGKYAHAGTRAVGNYFTNLSGAQNAGTLADASNDFSGNVDVANGYTIKYNYDAAPTSP